MPREGEGESEKTFREDILTKGENPSDKVRKIGEIMINMRKKSNPTTRIEPLLKLRDFEVLPRGVDLR